MDDGLSSGHTQFGIDVSAVDEVGMLQGGEGGLIFLFLSHFISFGNGRCSVKQLSSCKDISALFWLLLISNCDINAKLVRF